MASSARSMPLSSFEKLPAELLLKIFEMSENPALMYTTNHIHGLVKYKGVRKQLVQYNCLDQRLQKQKSNISHFNLRRLLQSQWFSFPLVIEVMNEWRINECEPFVYNWLQKRNHPAELVENTVQVLRKGLSKDLAMIHPDTFTTPYGGSPAPKAILEVIKNELSIQIAHIGQYRTNLLISSSTDDYDGNADSADFNFLPTIGYLGAFPSALLGGPWTQDQGDLLAFFTSALCTNTNASPKHIKDASIGLSRALDSENLVALSVLGGQLRKAFPRAGSPDNHNPSPHLGEWRTPIMSEPFIPDRQVDSSEWRCIRAPVNNWGDEYFPDQVWTLANLDKLLIWLWHMENKDLATALARSACRVIFGSCRDLPLARWRSGSKSKSKSQRKHFSKLDCYWKDLDESV